MNAKMRNKFFSYFYMAKNSICCKNIIQISYTYRKYIKGQTVHMFLVFFNNTLVSVCDVIEKLKMLCRTK